jgi:WD40 repeat protein
MNIVKHETIETNERTNVAYCCTCVPGDEGVFLVGTENKLISKFKFDPKYMELEKLGFYKGHSNSVRHVDVSKSNKHMLSTCEDHSLRIWDYITFEPLVILSGHQNNAVIYSYS